MSIFSFQKWFVLLHMFPWRTWVREETPPHLLHSLHQCAFSNASSSYVPQKRHSRIGCICLTFLHCAFSDASSNCLPVRMQSHIGCICMTFLRRTFWDDFFSQRMYTYICSSRMIFFLLYLCFSWEHLHWPYWSDHLQDFDPSPPIMDCCLLRTVSFKLRKWGFRKGEKWKWESLHY